MSIKLYCIIDGETFLTKGMRKRKTPYFWVSKHNFNLAIINGCLRYCDNTISDWVYRCSNFVVCEYKFCAKTKEIQLIKQTPLLDCIKNERKKHLERKKRAIGKTRNTNEKF